MTPFLGLAVTLGAGVALGLLGGGGSLLVVPALVYLFGRSPTEATAYSLVVVGTVSLAGTLLHRVHRPVPMRPLLSFGTASVATAFLVRAAVVPRLAETVTVGAFAIERDLGLMLAFAIFAFVAGLRMVRAGLRPPVPAPGVTIWAPIAGAGTGALTALLGAGGGFLVVPALIWLIGLSVEDAVGASLAIITAQCFAGALGALSVMPTVDIRFVFVLTSTALLGVAWGVATAQHIAPARLKWLFGWVLLIVATGMILTELR